MAFEKVILTFMKAKKQPYFDLTTTFVAKIYNQQVYEYCHEIYQSCFMYGESKLLNFHIVQDRHFEFYVKSNIQ